MRLFYRRAIVEQIYNKMTDLSINLKKSIILFVILSNLDAIVGGIFVRP